MKKFISLFFVLSLFTFASVFEVVNIRSNDTLSVRLGSSSNTQKIGDLAYNAKNIKLVYCKMTNRGSEWCKIKHYSHGNAIVGWVSSRYIRLTKLRSYVNYSNYRYRVINIRSNDTLSVRLNAGVRNQKIGDLAYNANNIKVIRCKNAYNGRKWCKVKHSSYGNVVTGWVSARYIAKMY